MIREIKDIRKLTREIIGQRVLDAVGDAVSIQDTGYRILYQDRAKIVIICGQYDALISKRPYSCLCAAVRFLRYWQGGRNDGPGCSKSI